MMQKYRLYLRRLSGQSQNGLGNSFLGPQDGGFGSISSLNGLDLQALASSGQIPAQSLATIQAAALGRVTNKSAISSSLVDQRNIFSFDNPNIRFLEGQQRSNTCKQVNLLHGIPTNMDSKQLVAMHHSSQPFGNMHSNVPSQSRAQTLNDVCSNLPSSVGQTGSIPGAVFSRFGIDNVRAPAYSSLSQASSSVVEFSGNNTIPLASNSGLPSFASKGMIQEEMSSEMKGPRSFLPNFDTFNELNQNRNEDWGLQNVASPFETPNAQGRLDVAPSVLVQPGFASDHRSGNIRPTSINKAAFSQAENSLRIKTERLPEMGFQNSLFPDQFGQEDLMSALLKQVKPRLS